MGSMWHIIDFQQNFNALYNTPVYVTDRADLKYKPVRHVINIYTFSIYSTKIQSRI